MLVVKMVRSKIKRRHKKIAKLIYYKKYQSNLKDVKLPHLKQS